jgi:hypothetical protein
MIQKKMSSVFNIDDDILWFDTLGRLLQTVIPGVHRILKCFEAFFKWNGFNSSFLKSDVRSSV